MRILSGHWKLSVIEWCLYGEVQRISMQNCDFECPFNLIGKLIMPFLIGQSWYVFKSVHTGGGPEQRFWHCFLQMDFVTRILVSSGTGRRGLSILGS